MPPRRSPQKRIKAAGLTQAGMERAIKRALARNGDNGLLLDIVQDVGEIKAGIHAIQGRLVVIEPTLWKLEARRIEGDGQRKLIGGILKLRHAVYAAMVTGAAWLGINLPKLN